MKRHTIFLAALLLALAVLFAGGCYYDVESELYPNQGTGDPNNFTYSGRVLPIIQNYCLSCHSQAQGSGGIVLEGYVNIRNSAVAGSLLCAIRHASGCSPMPQNSPKLAESDITAIQNWVDAGAPEN
jgi:hypothetical protein